MIFPLKLGVRIIQQRILYSNFYGIHGAKKRTVTLCLTHTQIKVCLCVCLLCVCVCLFLFVCLVMSELREFMDNMSLVCCYRFFKVVGCRGEKHTFNVITIPDN